MHVQIMRHSFSTLSICSQLSRLKICEPEPKKDSFKRLRIEIKGHDVEPRINSIFTATIRALRKKRLLRIFAQRANCSPSYHREQGLRTPVLNSHEDFFHRICLNCWVFAGICAKIATFASGFHPLCAKKRVVRKGCVVDKHSTGRISRRARHERTGMLESQIEKNSRHDCFDWCPRNGLLDLEQTGCRRGNLLWGRLCFCVEWAVRDNPRSWNSLGIAWFGGI